MKHLLLLIPLLFVAGDVDSAEYRTANFTVNCLDATLAKQVGDAAELYRSKHAKEWLGADIPRWYKPCPITVKYGLMGAGGATTFSFDRGHVFGWDMIIQGSPQRLLDSVVPHEVLHTVLASHFRKPVPRWADEGACTSVEVESEKQRQRLVARQVVGTQEQIPIRTLLTMKEYPQNGRGIAVLYAQGFYLSEFLINQKGKREFVKFLEAYFKDNDWDSAFAKHYGYLNQEQAYTAAYRANNNQYTLTVFTSSGCGPCDRFKLIDQPVLERQGYKVTVVDINTKQAKAAGIKSVPTFIVYESDNEVARLVGYQDATVLSSLLTRKIETPKVVKANQGIGIGYFGELPGSRSRSNPHRDFSAAQTQQMNQAIDSRSRVLIDQTISNRLGDLEKVIDGRIKNAILEVQSKLTDEQKAFINATESQKAAIAGLKEQIASVEAGKAEFVKQNKEAVAKVEEQNKALAAEVETAKNENKSLKATIIEAAKAKAIEAVKAHIGTGIQSAIPGAVSNAGWGTPVGLGVGALGWFLSRRRKEDEPTEPVKTKQ